MFVGSNERGDAFQNVIIPYQLLNWLHLPRGSSQSLFLRLETKALYPMPVYPASQKSLLCKAGYLLEFRVGMFLCPSQGGGGKRRLSLEKVVYSLTEWNTVHSACTCFATSLANAVRMEGWWEGPPPWPAVVFYGLYVWCHSRSLNDSKTSFLIRIQQQICTQ